MILVYVGETVATAGVCVTQPERANARLLHVSARE